MQQTSNNRMGQGLQPRIGDYMMTSVLKIEVPRSQDLVVVDANSNIAEDSHPVLDHATM